MDLDHAPDLDAALENIHADAGQAASVVYEALQGMAREIAAQCRIDLDIMTGLATDLMLALVDGAPSEACNARKYLFWALMNRLRSWRRLKDTRASSLTRPETSMGVTWMPRTAYETDPDAGLRRRFMLSDPLERQEERDELQHTVRLTRDLARKHLNPTDAPTIESLIEIALELTTPEAEANRLGLKPNALQARQSRARGNLLGILQELLADTPETQREPLRRVARLVEALRGRRGKS